MGVQCQQLQLLGLGPLCVSNVHPTLGVFIGGAAAAPSRRRGGAGTKVVSTRTL